MNLFQSILDKAKGGYNYLSSGQMGSDFYDETHNADPTQTLQYKTVNTISKPIQWTAEQLQQGGQQLADISMQHAQNVQNRGYRDESKIKNVVQHLLSKGYDQNTINQTVKNLDDQGVFQGSWINNPISGTLATIESGLSKGAGTMFQGISNIGSAPLQQNAGDALARYGKGAMETGLGAFQLASSAYPMTSGAKALIAPTVNTLFSTDTAGKVLEPINKGLDVVIGGTQEALGLDSQSQASKDIRDIGTTAGNLALFHYGQKGAMKGYDVSKPYIDKTGKYIVKTAENVSPKATQLVKTGINKVTPTAEGISTRANRFIAGDEQKFKDQIGETPGQFAVSRGMNEVGEKAIEKAQQNFEASKAEADTAFGMIEGKFSTKGQSNDIVGDLLRANMEKMKAQPRNKDRAMSEELYRKYESGEGLTMSEINEAKRIHARNHTYSYEQRTSNEARNASDIQNDIREWQFETAKQNGYTNADKVNMETKGWKMFADSLAKKMDRSGANNAIGITDWISLAGGNPTNVALFLGKKTASSNFVKTGAIKLLGKQTKPNIIQSSKADIQQANFQKNVNRGVSGDRSSVGGESMVKPAGLIEAPTGKSTGAKNFRVNQPKEKALIKNDTQKGNRPSTQKVPPTPKTIVKPTENKGEYLLEEARGYKSADDFIKAQGEPMYHGGGKKIEKFDNKYIGTATDPGIIGEGHYLTNNNRFATDYAKGNSNNVTKAFIKGKNIFDLHSLKTTKQFAEKLGMNESDFYQTSVGLIIPKDFKSSKIFGKRLQELGYEGASFERYPGSIETVVFDAKNIKTESQLRQIYEQAHKSSTQATGPRVIGKMGKVETKTAPQSPVAYELGSMGKMKPIQPKRLFAGENAKAPPKTGWVKGADGKMRFEIDDSKGKIIGDFADKTGEIFGNKFTYKTVDLGDLLEHDELFMQYPELKKIRVELNDKMGNSIEGNIAQWRDSKVGDSLGAIQFNSNSLNKFKSQSEYAKKRTLEIRNTPEYKKYVSEIENLHWNDPKFDELTNKFYSTELGKEYNKVSKDQSVYNDKFKSTLLHEIQHAIQTKEGFAKGGGAAKGADEYNRLSGEVEARNVQSRMNLTAQERKLKSPESTEDVPRVKQIVRTDTKGPMLSRGYTLNAGKKPIVKRTNDIDSGLIEEARKYNSFDEFKKAQGEPVYHGGVNLIGGKPLFKYAKTTKKSGETLDSNMLFFTDKREIAQFFADNRNKIKSGNPSVIEGYIDTSKILDFGSTNSSYGDSLKKLGYDINTLRVPNGDITNLFDTKEFTTKLQENGFKGISIAEKGGKTYGIIDENVFKNNYDLAQEYTINKIKNVDPKMLPDLSFADDFNDYSDTLKNIRNNPIGIIAKAMGGKKGNGVTKEGLSTMGEGVNDYIDIGGNKIYIRGGLEGSTYYLQNIFTEIKGKGLGTKFMNKLKEFSDIYGVNIQISKVANQDFFRKFKWLDDNYRYDSKTSFLPKQIYEQAQKSPIVKRTTK